MNLYKLSTIKNNLDRRLIDLFVQQNQRNDWLSVTDCAAWVFETNTPSEYQCSYTRNKLTGLVGALGTAERANTMFDMKHMPTERGSFVFRLKDAGVIRHQSVLSLKEQINAVYATAAPTCVEREECCIDELEF